MAVQEARLKSLKYLEQQLQQIATTINQHVLKAKAEQSADAQAEMVAEGRQLLAEYAELLYDATGLKMQLAGEMPDWSISDQLYNQQQNQYALIRVDGASQFHDLIIEIFDQDGQGALARIDMYEFYPERWTPIPAEQYQLALDQHLQHPRSSWSAQLQQLTNAKMLTTNSHV
jgi:hypothetical protein